MNTKALVFAAIATCLASSAFAQSYEYRGDGGDRYEQRDYSDRHDRYDRYDRYGRYDGDDRRYRGAYERRDGYYHGHRRYREGAGPHGDLYSGSRLPHAFWGVRYRVNDWHRARLGPPARGHRWTRVGNDYAMVNVSTGIISRVVLR